MLKNVLVVDDNFLTRKVIKRIVTKNMAQATSSANGAEALDLLLENDPVDYIITDYKMPVMDGLQFLNTYQVIKEFLENENTMYIY